MNLVKRLRRKSINPKGTEYVRCPKCSVLYKHTIVHDHMLVQHGESGWK